MLYLVTQILFFLLVAFVLGVALGWFARASGPQVNPKTHARLVEAFEAQEAQLESLRRDLASRESQLAELEIEIGRSTTKVQELEQQLSKSRGTAETLKEQLADCRGELDTHRSRVRELEREVHGRREALESQLKRLAELERMFREPETLPPGPPQPEPVRHAATTTASTRKGTAPTSDDLQQIRGIGPAIERVLNALGYHTFRDVASWDHDAIARVSEQLGALSGRILRDRWVQQAKQLHARKYGETI